MADALQHYVKEGYMYGPFTVDEMPWGEWKTSPLTMRPKPDGSARLIVDMSHPHEEGVKIGDGKVMSVNAAINDELEVVMTSIKRWTGVLHWVGCPAEACKNDWNCAYKHMEVVD